MRTVTRPLSLFLLVLLASACSSAVTAQQQVLIVSPTPAPGVISITVTPAGAGQANVIATVTSTPLSLPATVTVAAGAATQVPPTSTVVVATAVPVGTATPQLPQTPLTALPAITRQQVYIAQQDFEHGYMYWISTRKEIWVLIKAQGSLENGEWRVYPDTFVDGEPETDPSLTVPSALLFQPKRGFGKVWRLTLGLRDMLGWATTPEFDLRTPFVYQPGAAFDSSGKLFAQPGHYELTNLYCQPFMLNEAVAGQFGGTWSKIQGVQPGSAQPDGKSTPVPTPTAVTPVAPGSPLTALPSVARSQLYIAQQDFQGGYMFWISNQSVIWVLLKSPGTSDRGEWRVYPDTFKDGEPETDPSLVAPTLTPAPGTTPKPGATPQGVPLYQPRRGFGKLWRTIPGLRDALGWGTTPDFDLRTPFIYVPGVALDPAGKLTALPGQYLLTTLGCETFAFSEPQAGQSTGTWTRIGGVHPGSGD